MEIIILKPEGLQKTIETAINKPGPEKINFIRDNINNILSVGGAPACNLRLDYSNDSYGERLHFNRKNNPETHHIYVKHAQITLRKANPKKTGLELIAEERQRQIEEFDYYPEHDKASNREDQLALAAAVYAIPDNRRSMFGGVGNYGSIQKALFPWSLHHFKSSPNDRIRELQKAGALIAAEIDRLLILQEEE